MNAIVEQINSGGYAFVEFAASMLIQASVLIVLLLTADFVLRKKVRAVFRYWMWLLVLVKLVLPTSLSGPFSIGYWFGDKLDYADVGRGAYEPPVAGPMMPALPYIDTSNVPPTIYPPATFPVPGEVDVTPTQPIAAPAVPPVQIEWQGIVFVVWLAVAAAMSLLLVQRAVFVHGLVAQAREASRAMYDALEECRSNMKTRGKVGLKVSPNAASPAVCGLLRPVILVPQNLASALDTADLRIVLLHELAHVKRGDLWVNLAQTLLQIVYFYNPLLWLANAVIRRAREQAVDEAVLVAMGEKARRYPQTLVSVAKLAFKRPALSLRLIGVVESKSALAARIKRILSRPIPKSAKLGILGLAVIVITAAILLPMAKAQAYTDRARQVMALPEQEARRLKHEYVGTEHILLALSRQDEGVGGQVLQKLGIRTETVEGELAKLVKTGSRPVTKGSLPQTARAKKALELAEQEAKALDHDYIGTEHILLGLMRETDGLAAQIVTNLGASYEVVREEVLGFVKPGANASMGDAGERDPRATPITSAYEKAEGSKNLKIKVGPSTFKVNMVVRWDSGGNPRFEDGIGNEPPEIDLKTPDYSKQAAWMDIANIYISPDSARYDVLELRVFDHKTRDLLSPKGRTGIGYDVKNSIVQLRSIGAPLPDSVDVWVRLLHNPEKDSVWKLDAKAGASAQLNREQISLRTIKDGLWSHSTKQPAGGEPGQIQWTKRLEWSDVCMAVFDFTNVKRSWLGRGEKYQICAVGVDGKRYVRVVPPFTRVVSGATEIIRFGLPAEKVSRFEIRPFHGRDTFYFDNVKLPKIAERTFDPPPPVTVPVNGKKTEYTSTDLDPISLNVRVLPGIAAASVQGGSGTLPARVFPMSEPHGNLDTQTTAIYDFHGIELNRCLLTYLDNQGAPITSRSTSIIAHGAPARQFTGFETVPIPIDKIDRVVLSLTDDRVLPRKEASLSDAEWMRQMTVLSVGELIDVLAETSMGKDKSKWFAAIHRLVEIGAPAVPEIVAEIRKTEKPQTQSRLALTLRAIGDANAVPGLIDALERSGFSSDYGLGEPKTELEWFYKTYQMDSAEESLGLGRPVREITVALERLTGHSEGHKHYQAYDAEGNELGSYTVTPEIIDREREHRREVAEKWRVWWQANKDKIKPPETPAAPPGEPKPPEEKGHEGRVIAAPEGAQLTLAIVPNVDGSTRQPSLSKEQYQKYLDDLAENGPFAGSVRGDSFQWSPVKGDASRFKGLPLSTYKDRTYILLCARAQYVMMPEVEGKWIWGLEKVEAASNNGRPAINIRFDENGAELLGNLTKANIENRLAIGVDGWVLSAPVIKTPINKRALIIGDLTEQDVRGFVSSLRKGMPAVEQQAVEAMRRIADAAEKLGKGDLQNMGPRQIVENVFVVGPAGDAEKLAWFFRSESLAAKGITVHDFAQMADTHKIEVLEVYADANDALAVTSNIKGKDGEEEGRLIFYLSKQTGTWLIHDGDVGDPQRVQDDVTRFKNKHPNAKLDSSSQAVDRSQAAILPIIERLRSAEYIRSGKGSALVVEVESGSSEQSSSTAERIVDFKFMGNLTRSDAFTCEKGKRADFIHSWATGPMSSVRSNGRDDATVQGEPFSDFHRQVGYDFHPETFLRYQHFHLAELLECMIGQPDVVLEVAKEPEDMMLIVGQAKDEISEQRIIISLIDGADGVRLASWESTSKDLTDNGTDTSLGRLQLDWKKYSGVWYISGAISEGTGVHDGLRTERRTTVTIRDFTPNIEIEEKEFTLDGLDIRSGATVHDAVLGTTYKYAGAKDDSAERLRRLGTALLMYSNDYDDKFPDTIEQAKQFLNANDLKWLVENVQYLGKGKSVNDDPQMPLAYDRTMLEGEQSKGTNLLSISGIVSFRTGEELEKLGIGRPVCFAWGEEVKGLRAAVEFVPEKQAYTPPARIDLRLHIQNVSDKAIQFTSSDPTESHVIIEDAKGKEQGLSMNISYHLRVFERYRLQPGEELVLKADSLGIASSANEGGISDCRWIMQGKPGVYFFRLLEFTLSTQGPQNTQRQPGSPGPFTLPLSDDDWRGMLETGRHKLVVAVDPNSGNRPR